MEQKPYKLRVKLGEAEFEAEGEEEVVREQYEMFLEAISGTQDVVAQPRQSATDTQNDAPDDKSDEFDSNLLDRLFSVERGVLSLRVLPQTKSRSADALLLLIYGFMKLQGEHDIFGTKLMKSARQSGLSIDRVDRVISAHKGLYMRGGARRGAKYTLNNQGVKKAEEIIEKMFQ